MSNLSDGEFKTLAIRMLKELSEYFNSIKKSQAEMKDILMKMNNLQGVNSRVDEAENEIHDVEHKETKNNHEEQQQEESTTLKQTNKQNKQTKRG